jgi:hypothetical protein
VVNYEEFSRNLSNKEQQQLMKFLPAVDTAQLPDWLVFYTIIFSRFMIVDHLDIRDCADK